MSSESEENKGEESFVKHGARIFDMPPKLHIDDALVEKILESRDRFPSQLSSLGVLGVEGFKGKEIVASFCTSREALLMDRQVATLFPNKRLVPSLFLSPVEGKQYVLRGAGSSVAEKYQNNCSCNGISYSGAGFLALTPVTVTFQSCPFDGESSPPERDSKDFVLDKEEENDDGEEWEVQAGQVFFARGGMAVSIVPSNDEETCLVRLLAIEDNSSKEAQRFTKVTMNQLICNQGVVPSRLNGENDWLWRSFLDKHKIKVKDTKEARLCTDYASFDDFPEYFIKKKEPKESSSGKKEEGGDGDVPSPSPSPLLEEADALLELMNSHPMTKTLWTTGSAFKSLEKAISKAKEKASKNALKSLAHNLHTMRSNFDELTLLWKDMEEGRARLSAIPIPGGSVFDSCRANKKKILKELKDLEENAKSKSHNMLCENIRTKLKKIDALEETVESKRNGKTKKRKSTASSGGMSPISYDSIEIPDAEEAENAEKTLFESKEEANDAWKKWIGKNGRERFKMATDTLECQHFLNDFNTETEKLLTAIKSKSFPLDATRFIYLCTLLTRLADEKERVEEDYKAKRAKFEEENDQMDMAGANSCRHPRDFKHWNFQNMCQRCFKADVAKRMGLLNLGSDRYYDAVTRPSEPGDSDYDSEDKDAVTYVGSEDGREAYEKYTESLEVLEEADLEWKGNAKSIPLAKALFSALMESERLLPEEYRASSNEENLASDDDDDDEEDDEEEEVLRVAGGKRFIARDSEEDEESNYDEDEESASSDDEEEESSSSDDRRRKKKKKMDAPSKQAQAAMLFMDTFSENPFNKERTQGFSDYARGYYDKVIDDARAFRANVKEGLALEFTDKWGKTRQTDEIFSDTNDFETHVLKHKEFFPNREFREIKHKVRFRDEEEEEEEEQQNKKAKKE